MKHLLFLFLGFSFLFVLLFFGLNFILNYIEERKKILARLETVAIKGSSFFESNENLAFKQDQQSLFERRIAKFLKNRPSIDAALRLKLYRAGMTGHLSPLIAGTLLLSISLIFVFSYVSDLNYFYMILYIFGLPILFMYIVLNFFEKRFKNKIATQLPNAIDIVLRGIKSGSSVEKTFQIVVKEVDAPLKDEFVRIIQQIEFGISFDEALHQAADRVDLSDFYFFTTSLIIQRKAGGSLSEILENIIVSLNRANEIRNKIKTLTAEGKMTAYILGSIPVVVFMAMLKLNPTYVSYFLYDPSGKRTLMIVFGLMGCAGLCIRQLIRVKI